MEAHLKKQMSEWSVVAIGCVIAAVVGWFVRGAEASFVFATLGAVAWFMNVRSGFHAANAAREDEIYAQSDIDEDAEREEQR